MKRFEYKFNNKVVCIVDEGMNDVAFFRTMDGRVTKCIRQDAHALATAFLEQLKGVTPPPNEEYNAAV
jgi:hypothetical protein